MADIVDTTSVTESVAVEAPAEDNTSKVAAVVAEAEAAPVETNNVAEAEKTEAPVETSEVPADGQNGAENSLEGETPKENGTSKEEKVATKNGVTPDEGENLKRKTADEVESTLEDSEVTAEKKAKLEEKSEAKQDEVENSKGEAEVAA